MNVSGAMWVIQVGCVAVCMYFRKGIVYTIQLLQTEPTAEPVVVVEPAAPDEEPAKKSEDDGPDFLQNQPEQVRVD